MSFVIPINRLRETDTLMAFYHPQPADPFHVILVPKKQIPAWTDMDPNDSEFLRDLYSTPTPPPTLEKGQRERGFDI
jgi:hypothetical protein